MSCSQLSAEEEALLALADSDYQQKKIVPYVQTPIASNSGNQNSFVNGKASPAVGNCQSGGQQYGKRPLPQEFATPALMRPPQHRGSSSSSASTASRTATTHQSPQSNLDSNRIETAVALNFRHIAGRDPDDDTESELVSAVAAGNQENDLQSVNRLKSYRNVASEVLDQTDYHSISGKKYTKVQSSSKFFSFGFKTTTTEIWLAKACSCYRSEF